METDTTVESTKCSRQKEKTTSNLERVLPCSHPFGVLKQNETNIFLFQHTMCRRAPRQLMKWDLAHFHWSWKAAGLYWNIKFGNVWNVWENCCQGKCFLWSYEPLVFSKSLSSPSLNSSKIPKNSIISVTYGEALHQTLKNCNIPQLQLRMFSSTQCFEPR